jgi:crotonobetainyl-CoA:carnitine CoA-transferase CaiB-like acyl-CoA transferase
MPEGANRPLAGITVLDFGQVYPGPYATLLMAKAGADVIKIEPPQGEPLRRRAPPGKSTTFPIAMLNSNKRAITLNLKHERGPRAPVPHGRACRRIAGAFRALGSWTGSASAGRCCTG